MKVWTSLFTVALVTLAVRPAAAQGIDIGGSLAATRYTYDSANADAAGAMVTFHFSPRHALQVATDISVDGSSSYRNVQTIFLIQYRHTFTRPANRTSVFVTVGTAGGAEWHRTNGFTYIDRGHYEQGKWVATEPKSYDYPAQTHVAWAPPILPIYGAGVEVRVSRRLALRADLTGAIGPYFIVGIRASTGLVLRLGRSQ